MPKVLVIEDTKFIRRFLKKVFNSNGFDVIGEVETVDEGIKLYKENKPDLVTMDIILPGKSGIEGIKEIIKVDKSAKILVCSSLGQELLKANVIEAGAKDCIVKPFKEKEIIEKARNIIEQVEDIKLTT